MFEHSVRVPRHFKIAANIVQKVSQEGGSVKTLLYDNKLKHFRTNVLYALINETIKHTLDIENIFENIGIFLKEPRLDPWLAKVLTAELLYGKKTLPGKSKPEQTILSYKEQFEKLATEVQDDQKSKVVPRPRYVRINTNLLTTSDAIRAFQDEGYKFIRCTSGSYNDYLQQVQSLTEYDFTQDYHVKTIFVFYPRTKFHEHDLYLENKIILQDKATALAVHLLAPPVGSVVLDMCAAPGMKTTQLAAYLRNQGKIYAVERNEKRYETLCQYVEATGSKCVETFHKDSLEIKRGDMDDVEYILLDPSCTGSGMELSVHNYVEETRLAKLTSLQEKFLKHAMNSFPNAKRIVYSTCSIYPEENERVVTNIVKASRAKWRVKDVKELLKDQWNNFGSGMYGSMGTRCLYAKSNSDFTTGFFLAVLDRDFTNPQDDENKTSTSHNNNNIIHRKEEQNKIKDNISNIDSNIFHNENSSEDINDDVQEGNKKLGRNKKDKDLHSKNTNYCDKSNNAIENKCNSPLDLKKKKKSKLAGEKISDEYEDVSIDISIGTKEENTDKKNRVKVDLEGTKTDNSVIITEDNEPLMEKKKKKKHKFCDKNSELNEIKNHNEVFIAPKSETADKDKKKTPKKSNVIEILESENTSNVNHEIETDLPNKRKKKDKMHVIENEEQVKNKKHSKDSKNEKCNEPCESIVVHQKKRTNMKICDDIETLESGQIVKDNNYSYKKKKKKHKLPNKDIEKSFPNTLPNLELNECIDETKKKSNKKKRYESADCKITYESCTGSTNTKITEKHKKKKRKDSKDMGISDTNQLYGELPKKKKKKLESFES